MYDDFLTDVLILFYKIVEKFTTNLIIDEFRYLRASSTTLIVNKFIKVSPPPSQVSGYALDPMECW